MSVSSKNILITGASSGLGAALAKGYAAEGVYLALSGRNTQRLSAVAEQCRQAGAQVTEKIIDVTDQAAMHSWIEEIDRATPLDLVIANAGISGGTGGADEGESFAQIRQIFDINLTGVLNTVEPVIPFMVARRCGQIALMSSLASFSGWPGAPAYSASKGAVRLYGEAIRNAMASKNVKINVICPGFVRTPMTDVNEYPMPFLMDDKKAAQIMIKGLAGNKGRIAFPWPTFLLAGFFGILPHWLSATILSRLPEKPQR